MSCGYASSVTACFTQDTILCYEKAEFAILNAIKSRGACEDDDGEVGSHRARDAA